MSITGIAAPSGTVTDAGSAEMVGASFDVSRELDVEIAPQGVELRRTGRCGDDADGETVGIAGVEPGSRNVDRRTDVDDRTAVHLDLGLRRERSRIDEERQLHAGVVGEHIGTDDRHAVVRLNGNATDLLQDLHATEATVGVDHQLQVVVLVAGTDLEARRLEVGRCRPHRRSVRPPRW